MKKTWEFIVDYYDTFIALGVSAIAGYFGVRSNNSLLLLGAISATLAVLSGSIIRDRKDRKVLSKQITELQTMLPSQLSAMAFFRKDFPEEVKLDIDKAQELWLVGFRLSRTLPTYIAMLDKKLMRGEKIKVILLDPESQAVHYSNQTMSYAMKLEQFRESIRTSISLLRGLEGNKTGNLEVRLIDHPLPFGGYCVNIQDKEGKMYIKQYEYRAKTDGIRFILTPKDGVWYDIYLKQLKSLWEDAKPIRKTASRQRAS